MSVDGLDEELPQPRRRRRRELPRGQRLRLDLGLAAVLLIVVTLAGNALLHRDHAAQRTPAQSPRPGLPNVATDFVTVRPIQGGYLPQQALASPRCTESRQCRSVAAISDPVRSALTAAFPGLRITGARTVWLHVENYGDALSALDVNARRGDERIVLRLRGAPRTDVGRDPSAGGGTMIFGGHRILRYEATLVQYYVLVQVVAPAGEPSDLVPLAQLAEDVRLLELP